MREYSAGALPLALLVTVAFPVVSLFAQTGVRSQDPLETSWSPHPTSRSYDIAPGQALSFVLDDSSGVAYFTSEPDGLRLVATIKGTSGPVFRFVVTLAPDQMTAISVPRRFGEDPVEVLFSRHGEGIVVKSPALR